MHDQCRALEPDNATAGVSSHRLVDIHVTGTVLYFREQSVVTCGKLRNLSLDSPINYDLLSGGRLNYRKLLKLYVDPAESVMPIKPNTVYTPTYKMLLNSLSPQSPYALAGAFKKAADGSDCFSPVATDISTNINALPKYFSYGLAFTDKGLVLSVDTYPDIPECSGDYFLVPYKDIGPLWRAAARDYFPEHVPDYVR